MNVTARQVAIGSLLALCVVTMGPPAASTLPAAPTQRLESRFEVGEPFPEIALPSLDDGTPTTMAAFRGEKVILHVFASW